MKRLTLLLFSILALFADAGRLRGEEPSQDAIRQAVARSLPLLDKGAAGHMGQKTCYACHNQGLPILALTLAGPRGFKEAHVDLGEHMTFINDFLDKNRESYLKGRGQGGQVATAGYALWTLEMGGFQPNATTAAVAEYLLEFQKDRDHWRMTSNRPPSETSHFTANYLAIRGLQTYGSPAQRRRIAKRLDDVRAWLLKTPAKDTEDRVFRLWSLQLVGADGDAVRDAAEQLAATQQENGGWGQLDGMAPDSYATGSALVALHQAAGMAASDPRYQRGVQFLLDTQLPDGSWHVRSRSKPFQTYFETGYPHGKDQFISVSAGGWATAALALACEP
jgi:hypothetical protein